MMATAGGLLGDRNRRGHLPTVLEQQPHGHVLSNIDNAEGITNIGQSQDARFHTDGLNGHDALQLDEVDGDGLAAGTQSQDCSRSSDAPRC